MIFGHFRERYDKAGDEDIEGAFRKFLDTRMGSEKIKVGGGGAPKICILQNQQDGGGHLKN